MEDRKLDAAESLALISSMIENTRNRMIRHSGRPFLIWGYTTVAVTAAVAASVTITQDPNWNWLWIALPVIGALLMWLTRERQPAEGRIRTFVDRVIAHIWLVMGLAVWFVSLLSAFAVVRPPILFVVMLVMGIGTATTGLIIRFTPITVGGIAGIIIAPLLIATTGWWTVGLFAAGFVVMMIIPGHILNYKSRQLCSKN